MPSSAIGPQLKSARLETGSDVMFCFRSHLKVSWGPKALSVTPEPPVDALQVDAVAHLSLVRSAAWVSAMRNIWGNDCLALKICCSIGMSQAGL